MNMRESTMEDAIERARAIGFRVEEREGGKFYFFLPSPGSVAPDVEVETDDPSVIWTVLDAFNAGCVTGWHEAESASFLTRLKKLLRKRTSKATTETELVRLRVLRHLADMLEDLTDLLEREDEDEEDCEDC